MRCAESLRVQAYFDAEVDAVSAADIEQSASLLPRGTLTDPRDDVIAVR